MADKYRSFTELAKNAEEGKDFRVRLLNGARATAIIAPHGGGIEPGTSEIAVAIAQDDLSFYAFEGIKPNGNGDLHITSTRFDEPRCIRLVTASEQTVAIHGENSDAEVVFLGGRDDALIARIRDSLLSKGFKVEKHSSPALQGCDQTNICNRTKNQRGVQMELSSGLRRSFFTEFTSGNGRQNSQTAAFHQFVAAVREAIL
jgi:phage replication-related protein YjqB (UPF0714/DUF867 family)